MSAAASTETAIAPGSYPGGKAGEGVYQQIICQIPPHRVYVELFLGGGAIMRYKKPAPQSSVGVEINARVIASYSFAVPNLEIKRENALDWLKQRSPLNPAIFLYADPPYLMSTRRSKKQRYEYDFHTVEEHRALVRELCKLRCNVAISGYWSELYELELAGWRAIQFPARTRGGKMAEEWLWMNYPQPLELHDYSYLGHNFRERERIKRRKQRWTAKLAAMDAQERYALMEAIAEVRGGISSSEVAMQARIAGNNHGGQHRQKQRGEQ